jgi:geranylgeranyl diphosphate synthase type II
MLDKYDLIIEEKLSSFSEKETKGAIDYHDFIGRLYEDLHEYVSRRGKRLASCSTLLIYKGFDKEVDDRILSVCAGVELYRHSILVHDDFVDQDEARRGGSTIHKKYSREHDPRFGDGSAVFAGNILYTLALKAFTGSDFEPGKIVQILNLLNDAFQAVNESQVLDLLFEYKKPDVEEWYVMASKRAASLFKASLLIGAVLADASDRDLQLLREAGEHIGYCFDIQDDIIDTFASEERYGRKLGGDLSKHKKPLHIVYTYMMADPAQLETIESAAHIGPLEDLDRIRKVISDCGALKAAKKHSREHADSAKKLISETNMSPEVKDFFTSFIDYVKESLNWYK